jgi:serine/threonine-protein kinase
MSAAVASGDRFAYMTLATSGADHLLITRNGRLRAIGFADILDTGVQRISEIWSPFTAPELFFEGRQVDLRADIYAAGVLLFQLLTLRSPISVREPTMHLAYRLYRNLHPVVSDVVPELSDFDPVVARAMRWLPEERYPEPAALKSALLAACPAVREAASPDFSDLFQLALDLRNRRRPAAESRGSFVGMKVSTVD